MARTKISLTPGRIAAYGLVLVAVLFLALNVLAGAALRGVRADLTADRVYTVSAASRQVLADLPETVVLRLYVSRGLTDAAPAFGDYARRVEDLLQVYRSAAHGKLQVEKIQPEPFSEEEDRAVAAGLQAVPLDRTGAVGFFGIVGTNLTDDSRTVPFLALERERFLEQDLTRLVYDLAHPDKPKLGVVDGIGLMAAAEDGSPRAGGGEDQLAFQQLREIFQVSKVDPAQRSALDGVDVLLVAQPDSLDEAARYNLDQVVLGGKPALLVLDPMRDATVSGAEAASKSGPPALLPLIRGWGVDFTADAAVADWQAGEDVQANVRGRPVALRWPLWIGADKTMLAQGDAITAELQKVNIRAGGAFSAMTGDKAPKDALLQPLVSSSADSTVIPTSQLQVLTDPRDLQRQHPGDDTVRMLAARLVGTVHSGFSAAPAPAAPPPEGQSAPVPPAHLATGNVDVVMLGDADMLMDRAWVQVGGFMGQRMAQPLANNGDLLVNALQGLAGVPGLHGLRGRGLADRPFTRLVALQEAARAQYQEREQSLQQDLQKTQDRLNSLSGAKVDDSGNVLLTVDQQKELQSFRERQLQIRKELRDVQGRLRSDVERVEVLLKLLTVVAVPALAVLAAIGIALWQRRHRARAAAAVLATLPPAAVTA